MLPESADIQLELCGYAVQSKLYGNAVGLCGDSSRQQQSSRAAVATVSGVNRLRAKRHSAELSAISRMVSRMRTVF